MERYFRSIVSSPVHCVPQGSHAPVTSRVYRSMDLAPVGSFDRSGLFSFPPSPPSLSSPSIASRLLSIVLAPPLHLRLSRRSPLSFTSVVITHFTLRSPLDARTCRRSDEERTSLPTRLSIESLISPSPHRASFRLPSLSHHCALRRDSSACDAFLASRFFGWLFVSRKSIFSHKSS